MAKSKSSSKSVVNSIESVLPKGISLIHVLLAIGLGIMICSFLNNSRVEGFWVGDACSKDQKGVQMNSDAKASGGSKPAKCEKYSTPFGGEGYKWVEVKSGGGKKVDCVLDPPPTATDCTSACGTLTQTIKTKPSGNGQACAKFATYKCKAGEGDCKKNADAKNKVAAENHGSGGTSTWKYNDSSTGLKKGGSGLCIAKPDHPSEVANCKGKKTFTDCDTAVCDWTACGKPTGKDKAKDWVNEGEYQLDGASYENIVKCLGMSDELPEDDAVPWDHTADILPLSGKADPPMASKFKFTATTNFLHKVGCTYSKGTVNCKAANLPELVKDRVAELANDCVGKWNDDFPKAYKNNGDGPLMSFDKDKGLYCKNPLMEKVEIPGTVPRLINSEHCKKDANGKPQCPCTTDSKLEPDEKLEWYEKYGHMLADNTYTPNCHNKKFRGTNENNCLTTHSKNYVTSRLSPFVGKMGEFVAMTGNCS
jgi:hypothetical protein